MTAGEPGRLPLSFGQEALWVFEQLMSGSAVYHVPLVYRIFGPLEVVALGEALAAIVKRHEVLRTALVDAEGTPGQVVIEGDGPGLTVEDVSGFPTGQRLELADEIVRSQVRAPFDLARGQVFRAHVVRCGQQEHLLIIVLHHVVADGWSSQVLITELSALYQAIHVKKSPCAVLPELPVQYADYALWQREWLNGTTLEERLRYWTERLDGLRPLELPGRSARPRRPTFAADRLIVSVDPALYERAVTSTRHGRGSLLAQLGAAFAVTLAALTGRSDISFGTILAGRPEAELESLIGYFVNTVVLRADLAGDHSFQHVSHQLNHWIRGAADHEVPFGAIVERLAPRRTPAGNPLVRVVIQLLSGAAVPVAPELPPALVETVDVYQGQHPFDLTVTFIESADGPVMHVEYSLELFDAAFAASFADRMLRVLSLGAREPNATVRTLISYSDNR